MSMKSAKTGFTIHIDGLVIRQIDERAAITRRSRSGEICYLLTKALEQSPTDEQLALGGLNDEIMPVRTSIYIEVVTLTALDGKASELHMSTGRLINLMLKFILDFMVKQTLDLSSYMEQRGQAALELSQTSEAASLTD